jgi:signal peptidase I
VACTLLYYFTQNPLFAVGGFVFLLAWVVYDLLPGKMGKSELVQAGKELVFALIVAGVVWVALQTILGTPSPIDVVTSCSMVPALQRGDLIIISGSTPKAPRYNFTGPVSNLLNQLSVNHSVCPVDYSDGTTQYVYCTNHVEFQNYSIPAVTDNDVLVFDSDVPSIGLVVHRAVASFSNGTNLYYLTKGDNNPTLDQEGLFLSPISSSQVEGHVVGRIPLVGYLKLFLFLQFTPPAGCNLQVVQN